MGFWLGLCCFADDGNGNGAGEKIMRPSEKKKRRAIAACVALAALTLSFDSAVQTQSPTPTRCSRAHDKLDRRLHDVLERGGSDTEQVIIRARRGRRSHLESALRSQGAELNARFSSSESFAAEIDASDLAWLTTQDGVERISADARVHSAHASAAGGLTGLRETLGLSSSWTGDGVGIAVLDSGIDASEDFGARLAASYDFTAAPGAAAANDDYGHGTHVSGLAVGEGKLSNSGEFMGVASKARLISLKVLDANGAGRTSDVIRAIEFAIQNRAALKIDILNLSLGHPIYEPAAEDPLVQAVEKAVRSGLIVVVAAGNYGRSLTTNEPGYAGITSPGNAPSAITVGAVDTRGTVSRLDDRVASYSSRGPTWYDGLAKPDLVAPGHGLGATAAVGSTLYAIYPQLRIGAQGGEYLLLSGTSMAAAVTTGVIAHMLEANRNTNGSSAPPLSPNAVKAVLQYTALGVLDHQGLPADRLTSGAGSLNADGAVRLARAIETEVSSGDWLDEGLLPAEPVSHIGGQSMAWSQTVVWGTAVLTGSTISVNHPAWASTVVWGTARTVVWGTARTVVWGTARTVVWGTNVVWDKPDLWASTVVWGTTTIGVTYDKTVVWGTTAGASRSTMAWADLDDLEWSPAPNAAALTLGSVY